MGNKKERDLNMCIVFVGVLQLLNVEIQNLGSQLYSSIEFTGVSAGSWVISSTIHQSCGVGIHASASHGMVLNDNVVFGTSGHGIDLEGQNYSLTNNLVILTMQSARSSPWVAGIKVDYANDIILRGNVVAGSERLGFHICGHRCSSEALWSDNVVHSSLHGLHLYKKREPNNCTGVSGFLAFKNFDYGAMVQTENSVDLQNITLVDNTIGLLAVGYVSSAPPGSIRAVQIVLRNSIIVATSSSFDCIQDRKTPQSANWTSTDRAPSNPRGGRIGFLWPVFTSEPNQWPQEPWHKVRSGHPVSGIMKLQGRILDFILKMCFHTPKHTTFRNITAPEDKKVQRGLVLACLADTLMLRNHDCVFKTVNDSLQKLLLSICWRDFTVTI